LTAAVPGLAQQEQPPAQVVTAEARPGHVAPSTEIVGSIRFAEISDVASEVGGKVLRVAVKDGQRVKQGDVLVKLSADLLRKELAAKKKRYDQAEAEMDLAQRNRRRTTKLFESKVVHEGEYDAMRLTAAAEEAEAASIMAELSRLNLMLKKKTIRAPFDGVVLSRKVYTGEWVSRGQAVAKVARGDAFDAVANAPESVFLNLESGQTVTVKAAGRTIQGKIYALIPKGDVATRTFPVKIRITDTKGLSEGMEARVRLPSGEKQQVVIVPRDAVIKKRGQNLVYAVVQGQAKPIPVQVVGYQGLEAGVAANGLKPGMQVVTKGNERLRPGQPVAVKKK
jgi:RND family efflux transporter MFP subunit